METKNIIIIAVIVIIIAILGVVFATGMLNGGTKNVETTPFETKFMDGSFTGNVKLVNDSLEYMHSYEDKEHHVTYNISTVDNSSALMEIYSLQGITNPEERSFNGNDWNIYFTQAVPGDVNVSDSSGKEMNIIIAESQAKKQGYLIYMIIDSNSDINSTGSVYGESYTDYMQPLLESITLKESNDVPKIYEEFGLTKDQFDQQMDLVAQYKAGNTSVLEGTG